MHGGGGVVFFGGPSRIRAAAAARREAARAAREAVPHKDLSPSLIAVSPSGSAPPPPSPRSTARLAMLRTALLCIIARHSPHNTSNAVHKCTSLSISGEGCL
jgi:hypothetical protein